MALESAHHGRSTGRGVETTERGVGSRSMMVEVADKEQLSRYLSRQLDEVDGQVLDQEGMLAVNTCCKDNCLSFLDRRLSWVGSLSDSFFSKLLVKVFANCAANYGWV